MKSVYRKVTNGKINNVEVISFSFGSYFNNKRRHIGHPKLQKKHAFFHNPCICIYSTDGLEIDVEIGINKQDVHINGETNDIGSL